MTLLPSGFTKLDNTSDMQAIAGLPDKCVKAYLFLLARRHLRVGSRRAHWGEVAAFIGKGQTQTFEALRALEAAGLADSQGQTWGIAEQVSGETPAELPRKSEMGDQKNAVQNAENPTPERSEGKEEEKKDIPSGAKPPAPNTPPAAPHEEEGQPLPSQPSPGEGGGESQVQAPEVLAGDRKAARETRNKRKAPAAPRPRNPHFDALATALYGRCDQLANASHIARVARVLADAAWTPEDVTYVVGRAMQDPFWKTKISPGAVEKHAEDWRRRYGPARPVARQVPPPPTEDDLSFNSFLFPQQVNG